MARTGLITALLLAGGAWGGQADVLGAKIRANGSGSYRITVTIRHHDTGWDHYANRWEVLGPTGQVIAVRRLLHPHINEQPFTRSLDEVNIPADWTWVKIRAHDLVHGYGGREVTLSIPRKPLRNSRSWPLGRYPQRNVRE